MAFTTKLHGSTKPQTNFATRKLAFFVVSLDGNAATNYDQVGSLFQKAVQGVQQVAELYALGTPSGSNFVVVLSDDTISAGGEGDTVEQILVGAINAAANEDCSVTRVSLIGNALA